MKFAQTLYYLLLCITTVHAFTLPISFNTLTSTSQDLFKRKGGGGGGGKGGGGGGTTGGGGGGTTGGGGARTGAGSIAGGRTSAGSGPAPSYGSGGRYYGGGAAVPYTAGGRSPGGLSSRLLPAAALGFFPGLFLFGAFAYAYDRPVTYHNDTSNRNETHPVQCLCAQYQECGCDNNTDTEYINRVANNASMAKLADANGTQTLFIDGTLPNGTTAAGGSDDDNTGAAGGLRVTLAQMSGWWMVVAGVGYTLWFM